MSGTITNGLTALLAAQRVLQTTSNNIANANTEGYVRQRVDLVASPGVPLGRITIGSGVAVADVTRIYDQFLAENLRSSTALEQRSQVFSDLATRVGNILGNPDSGIGTSVQRFFDQVNAVGRDPTSAAQRQQLLLEGENLASRFQQLEGQLDGLAKEINGRLAQTAGTVNQLAAQIATLNERIKTAGSATPADLLDQQDVLLKKLGAQIDISTVRQSDGSVDVFIGSGQSLVLGVQAARLGTRPDAFDGSRLDLTITTGGPPQVITGRISGGALGGLLAFRSEVLDPARQDLGKLATGVADAFNAQHRQGMDLNGRLGEAFFATSAPPTAASVANTGTASLTAGVTDARSLTGRDYELRFDGSAWSVLDARTGAAIPASGSGTAADPLRFDGLAVTATAGAAAGDRFVVRPMADAARSFRVALTSPAAIAAASPLVSRVDANNPSQATVGTPVVTDVSDPKLQVTATIFFDTPTTYYVYTGSGMDAEGPLPYTSGADIGFAGWTVQVQGQPQTGDRFYVAAGGAGSGDNRNALALAAVGQQGFFDGGTQSIANLGADIVASVGAAANRAAGDLTVQRTLREQAEIDVDNVSGVNLDEEAANLLRFQQAYQAASKVIGMADDLFRTLLQVIGR
ncbi:MAG: flagellar hook-associated protein FlgK [Gammaproteobacteria bacterium]|nr:flagellar hook-associated protein FlgK [Gammaproteobacteria bacterium]